MSCFMPLNILNKGLPQDNYDGDFSERSILLHALKYYKTIKQDYVTRIFSGVREEEKIAYISAVMAASGFFDEIYSKSALHKIFGIKAKVFKAIQEFGAEGFLDAVDHENKMQQQEQKVTRQKLWFETEEAKRRYEDYPDTKKLALNADKYSRESLTTSKWAMRISVLSILITLTII